MKSLKRPDFSARRNNSGELDRTALLMACGILLFFSWFFYRSFWAVIPLTILLPHFYQRQKEKRAEKQREILKSRTCQWLKSLSVNLRTGYSIENALREARKELVLLYGEEDLLAKALKRLNVGLDNNLTVDHLLLQLSEEVAVEELKDFAEIFRIARKSSGNLTEIVDHTTGIITEKTLVEKEIRTLVASKELEMRIMSVMPFGIILYIELTSPGYFQALYHNLTGVMIMTLNLIAYLAALHLSQKILKIAV